jgi:homogentisate 1,2-dioxygenase
LRRGNSSRGFVCENYGLPFRLAELGLIGSNGLANAADFQVPDAWYEIKEKPRWAVAEDTFRPPGFHRNCVAEYLGVITGKHEGKSASGLRPGGASLHNNWAACAMTLR